jgi:hypothetical protein
MSCQYNLVKNSLRPMKSERGELGGVKITQLK